MMNSFSGACGEQTYFRGGYPGVNHTLDEGLKAYLLSKVQISLGELNYKGIVVNSGVAYPTRLETMALKLAVEMPLQPLLLFEHNNKVSRPAPGAFCRMPSLFLSSGLCADHSTMFLLPSFFVPQANLAGTSGHKAVATYTATDALLPGQECKCSTPPLKRLHLPGNRFVLP